MLSVFDLLLDEITFFPFFSFLHVYEDFFDFGSISSSVSSVFVHNVDEVECQNSSSNVNLLLFPLSLLDFDIGLTDSSPNSIMIELRPSSTRLSIFINSSLGHDLLTLLLKEFTKLIGSAELDSMIFSEIPSNSLPLVLNFIMVYPFFGITNS